LNDILLPYIDGQIIYRQLNARFDRSEALQRWCSYLLKVRTGLRISELANIRLVHVRKHLHRDFKGFPTCLSIDVLESKGERRSVGQPGFRMHIPLSNKCHSWSNIFCPVRQIALMLDEGNLDLISAETPLFPYLSQGTNHRQTIINRFNKVLRLCWKPNLTTHSTRHAFVYLLMANNYTCDQRLKEGRWSCEKTAKPYEKTARAAWDHVRKLNSYQYYEAVDVMDMSSLSITSLHGVMKAPTNLDMAVQTLDAQHYLSTYTPQIFGLDPNLVPVYYKEHL